MINEIDAHLFLPQRVPVTELASLSSPDSAYTHTVSGLIGGTNYTVWMTSSTAQGDGGVQSEPQTVFLPEYGQSYRHTHNNYTFIHKVLEKNKSQVKQKVRVNIKL